MKEQTLTARLTTRLASPGVFWLVFVVLIVEALWIAFSSRYPMAFDEDFHLGIIKLYALHPSPLWLGQPPDADSFGSVATDPSYFYHFLMSFPYRFIQLFTHDQTIQVIWLRCINIALFVSALPLWRRLLRRSNASEAMINTLFAIFVLIPIVPLLAGQINYDNLVFPLTALAFLLASRLVGNIKQTKHHVPTGQLIALLSVCLIASIVKYAFLPIFIVICSYVLIKLWKRYHSLTEIYKALWRGSLRISKLYVLLGVGVLLIAAALFIQRDVANIVKYHTPVPSCNKVLSIKECTAYAPWNRDYILKSTRVMPKHNPIVFSSEWAYGMWLRSLFTLAGPSADYETRGPLLLPALASLLYGAVGLSLIVVYGLRVLRRSNATLRLLLIGAVTYCTVLWIDEYAAYVRTGQPVAINGRYLLPVLLPLMLFVGLCFAQWLHNRPRAKLAVAVIALFCFLWGGGAGTFVLRSSNYWYWPNTTIIRVNNEAQRLVGPVIPGFYTQTQFLR